MGNVTSAFFPTPDGEVGPPFEVLLADTVLAVVVVVSVVVAWVRGSRLAARIAAGCVILVAISAMPAFFVDVAPGVKALAGAITLVTVGATAAYSVRQATKRWSGLDTLARRAPYFSCVLIALVGIYMGYHGWTGVMQ